MQEIKDQLNNIQKDIHDLKVIAAVQSGQLSEHMRRTDLLEKRVEQVDVAYRAVSLFFKLLLGSSAILAAIKLISTIF